MKLSRNSLMGIALFTFFSCTSLSGQTDSLPINPPLHSIKVGFLEAWYSFEKGFSPQLTLNAELGFDAFLTLGAVSSTDIQFGAVYVPTLKLEPRFYYNLLKRQKKEKKVLHYSANYLAVSVKSNPWFTVSGTYEVEPAIQIIPKWGIRRILGQHFIFETAIGFGIYIDQHDSFGTPGMDLKFGYIF